MSTTILPEKIKVYITAHTETERHDWALKVAHRLATLAGGFTIETGTGGWVDDTGNLVQEPVSIVTAYNHDAESIYQSIEDLLGEFLSGARQDAVLVEVNGKGRILA